MMISKMKGHSLGVLSVSWCRCGVEFLVRCSSLSENSMCLLGSFKICKSYDVTVIQRLTSCHNNRMTTRVITLLRAHVMPLTTSVSLMHFRVEIMLTLKAIKSNFKGSYDKQNLTGLVISYELYETRRRFV